MEIDKGFVDVCGRLNKQKVKYVVCGGYAAKLHGIEDISGQERKTVDYDFIIENSEGNIEKVKEALKDINPQAKELRNDDLRKYITVMIVSEDKRYLDTDLISSVWNVNYEKANQDKIIKEINGVKIPVVSIVRLLEMKKGSLRPQDIRDTFWLTKIQERKK